MINSLNWFEIPANELSRAKKFYESIFNIKMHSMDFPNGLKMAMFPFEPGGIGGAICQHKDFYTPSENGSLVYLNANPDLQVILDRVASSGGEVLVDKTHISEQHGYMAVIKDSEGNKVALHSVA